jgi:hypothetical protein
LGSEVPIPHDLGSFVDYNDSRLAAANHRHCFSTKSNISTSFDMETFVCNTCTFRGKHRVLWRETERPDTVDDSPICFVLSDQCFPPVLPPEDEGECYKIIRIEDGGVVELVDTFIELTKGFAIPAGSVLLVSSASRLACIGTEAYAAEIDSAKHKLLKAMGTGVSMLHGLPILFKGTCNLALIKGLLDIEHWFSTQHGGRDIEKVRKQCLTLTFGKNIQHYSACGGGDSPGAAPDASASVDSPGASTHYPVRYMLPSLKRFGEKICFESPKYVAVPTHLDALSVVDEKNVVDLLAETLNKTFMTDLALDFSADRENVADVSMAESTLLGKRLIVIGASHATRLACALEDAGAIVIDLSIPGWRPSAESVQRMIVQLSGVLDEEYSGETIIVFQLYDNGVFLSCDEDGNRALPTKHRDGTYHVPGRLVYADRQEFRELFTTTLPLLRAGRDHTKFLLSPLVRYLGKSCCSDMSHIINSTERNYGTVAGQALKDYGTWLQDLAFTRRIRNFAVLNPNSLLRKDDPTADNAQLVRELWRDGPVHMPKDGYELLCNKLLDKMGGAKLSRQTEKKLVSKPVTFDMAKTRTH